MGNGCMKLLRAINMPHYIDYSTRSQVLSTLRDLLRTLGKIPLPLVRDHLSHVAMHAFHGYKHTTEPLKIKSLIEIAKLDTQLVSSAVNGNHRDLETVIERSLRTFGVKNSPFYRFLKQALQNKRSRDWIKLHQLMLDHKVVVPRTVAYRFNNIMTPQVRCIADHHTLKNVENKQDYYLFTDFLQKHNITTGYSDRKLFFEPVLAYTRLGTPVSLNRQRNQVKKTYSKLLRDSHRPVHPDAMRFADEARQDYKLPRIYRRRLDQFAEKSYSIDEQFKQIRSSMYS